MDKMHRTQNGTSYEYDAGKTVLSDDENVRAARLVKRVTKPVADGHGAPGRVAAAHAQLATRPVAHDVALDLLRLEHTLAGVFFGSMRRGRRAP
ncbi:hypothetical protein DFH07DRAFT_965303 [Mycena maculata]|uniref:Uncharacterized protein n=1 Tax=Mycena maculata TaxID=230809 RepID=A0AAD7N0R7_9AGAR|nr:hypothetical protein DFH07DRAFT_965303 [Mycena maculata]